MITVVTCPACRQNFQVPPERLGTKVLCPLCKHLFNAGDKADAGVATQSADTHRAGPPTWEKRPEDEFVKPIEEEDAADGEEDRRRRRRKDRKARDEDGLYGEVLRRRRKMQTEHRGALILTYGILSLVCSMGLLGAYFGGQAWAWANHDLQEMYAGRMDPSGETLTQVGRVLGIIGMCLVVVGFVVGLACGMMGGVTGGILRIRR